MTRAKVDGGANGPARLFVFKLASHSAGGRVATCRSLVLGVSRGGCECLLLLQEWSQTWRCSEQSRNRTHGYVRHGVTAETTTSKKAAELFACQGGDFVVIVSPFGRPPPREIKKPGKSIRAAPIRNLLRESLSIWKRKRARKIAKVAK